MRSIAAGLSVLCLALVVVGQDAEQSGMEAYVAGLDARTDAQVATLRKGVEKTSEAYQALREAAELFRRGGDEYAAAQATKAATAVKGTADSVSYDFTRAKPGFIAEMESEKARLEAHLARLNDALTDLGERTSIPAKDLKTLQDQLKRSRELIAEPAE